MVRLGPPACHQPRRGGANIAWGNSASRLAAAPGSGCMGRRQLQTTNSAGVPKASGASTKTLVTVTARSSIAAGCWRGPPDRQPTPPRAGCCLSTGDFAVAGSRAVFWLRQGRLRLSPFLGICGAPAALLLRDCPCRVHYHGWIVKATCDRRISPAHKERAPPVRRFVPLPPPSWQWFAGAIDCPSGATAPGHAGVHRSAAGTGPGVDTGGRG